MNSYNKESKSATLDLESLNVEYKNLLIDYKKSVLDYINYLKQENVDNDNSMQTLQGRAFWGDKSKQKPQKSKRQMIHIQKFHQHQMRVYYLI